MSQIKFSEKQIVKDAGNLPLEFQYLATRIQPEDIVLWIGEMPQEVGEFLIEQSAQPILIHSGAAHFHRKHRGGSLLQESLFECELERESIDFIYSHSAMEFEAEPEKFFAEFHRVLRDQGRIVVAEYDHHLMSHYPMAPHIETQLHEIARELQLQGLWDPYLGRKLYRYLRESDFREIRGLVSVCEIMTGSEHENDIELWEAWFQRLNAWKTQGRWKTGINLSQLHREVLSFFENPERFSYSPKIILEAIKAN